MYSLKRLRRIAFDGFSDLLPAMRQAFNENPADDRLNLVYGASPRGMILALAVGGILLGALFARFGPDFGFNDQVNWPAVAVGALYAVLIRRYLFTAKQGRVEDFPWLAASLVPAFLLLAVYTVITHIVFDAGRATAADPALPVVGPFLVTVTDALGVVAATTIAVAALCYSRNWLQALWDLAIRLLVFKIMVWVTTLVVLEIGIIGPIVAAILDDVFGLQFPDWLGDLVDQLSYAGLMSVIYLAVIGAAWTACRNSFPELLTGGHVNVLATIAAMAKPPKSKGRSREPGSGRQIDR